MAQTTVQAGKAESVGTFSWLRLRSRGARSMAMFVAVTALLMSTPAVPGTCGKPGDWLWDGDETLTTAQVLDRIKPGAVVLLGERHGRAPDHHWQSQVLSALVGRFDDLVIGYEMFRREQQDTLEQWRANELGESDFLAAVDWEEQWGFPAEFYLPLFRLNRMYAVPMVALNVDNELVRRIGIEGWEAVPVSARKGISTAAELPPEYRDWLHEIYERHPEGEVAEQAGFEGFVRAQSVWDRAMAEALNTRSGDDRVVAGVVGRGHVLRGFGIAHQLADLGHERVITMLALDPEAFCEARTDPPATAVFRLPGGAE